MCINTNRSQYTNNKLRIIRRLLSFTLLSYGHSKRFAFKQKRPLNQLLWASCCLTFNVASHAQEKFEFNIERQRADLALTLFAQQANTTLLFPYDLAEKETANSLQGRYTIELGIVKLLEGTRLYPVADESGLFSVKPVPETNRGDETTVAEIPEMNEPAIEISGSDEVEKIAIVGTRSSPRSVIDSPVPLDIIGSEEFSQQGSTDMLSMLTTLVPSLNVNDQPINDASSLVRPANLRGMASDHTLVLLNGKRRHRSAVITFLGGGLSDGAQGPDISNIPASALKQVEVLRDGAAAQYGSDAIAGVLNFVLKDDEQGGLLETRIGQYYEGDGALFQVQGNIGLTVADNGFANLSLEYRQQDGTSRSVQREDALQLIEAGNQFVMDPAQLWGSPDVDYDIKFAANIGMELKPDQQAYTFMNYAKRNIEGGFYYRHPHARKGVNDGGRNELGEQLLLVGDLDGLNNGIACPEVVISDNNVLDDDSYLLIADNSTPLGANCFAFNEMFPGGFTPRFGGTIEDASMFAGIRGESPGHWLYDVSVSIGLSKIIYGISNTINPSLGPMSPTKFSPGSARQLEKNFNIDVSRLFETGFNVPFNFAAGFEWRRENFSQVAGELESYAVGPLAYDPTTGQTQGFGIGSNGFPGYKPESAGDWGRGNWAVYGDVEFYFGDNFLLGLASRYEDFTDFGSTFDGKLTAKYDLNQQLSIRGSINTGFKAPTVGQSNVINVTTAFSSGGLEDQATLPPTNPISVQLGATALHPEESTNLSVGVVGRLKNNLFVTLDYFNIRLTDRISTTSALPLTDEDIEALLAQGVRDASSFSSAKYFTNDFDTTTQGIDLVMNYDTIMFGADTQFSLAYNWTDTNVDRVTVYQRVNSEDGSVFLESNLTPQRIRMLEENLPKQRANFTVKQQYTNFRALLRFNYYGDYYEDHLDASAGYDIVSGSELTFDIELGYRINEHFQLSGGAKNLFNNYPDQNPFSGFVGAAYPPTSPMGINGGFYYFRGVYLF